MLPPEARLPHLDRYVRRRLYFTLHAACQTGKTTMMRAFAERLRGEGYAALHVTFERSQGMEEVDTAEPVWLSSIDLLADELPESLRPPPSSAARDTG